MPQEIVRTTIQNMDDARLNAPGVYVIAYMGRIVYVGKASESMAHRINTHVYGAMEAREQLGKWLVKNADHENMRLDGLVVPYGVDAQAWTKDVEAACIRKFRPLLNEQLNG